MSIGHLERLDDAIRSSKRGSEREVKLAIARVLTDLKERKSTTAPAQAKDYFVASFRTLQRIRGAANAEARLECLDHILQFLYYNGLSSEAIEVAEGARRLATAAQKKKWLRTSENTLGIIHADLGNVAEAVPHHFAAITLARELDDASGEAIGWSNLGVALNYAGLYREAIPCLQRASILATSCQTAAHYESYALANQALSHFCLGNLEAGYESIREALKACSNPKSVAEYRSRVSRENTFVQIALALGKIDEAKQHAEACERFAMRAGGSRDLVAAKQVAGLCAIHVGNVEDGLAALEDVLAKTDNYSAMQVDTLRMLVNAYDEAGRPGKALHYLQELMSQLKLMRERSVAALLGFSPISASIPSIESDTQTLRMKEMSLRARTAESELFSAQLETLERLAVTAELKDEASGQHGYRVGKLSSMFAKRLGWKPDHCVVLEGAARLHDVGKISVPDRILFSSDELREAQRHFLYIHATVGAELLSMSSNPHLRIAEEVARYHHEWWNGKGYPNKLSGKRIPVHAQIVALADVFDALTHGRPYAAPWPADRALQEISGRAGSQFDPALVEVFVPMVQSLCDAHPKLDDYLGKGSFATPFAQARNRIRILVAAERERESREVSLEHGTS